MTWRGFLIGTGASLAGFLVGEYGAGLVLRLMGGLTDPSVLLAWVWLPWIMAAVLAGVCGGMAYRAREARWWHFAVVALPVPAGAYLVTLWYFTAHDVAVPGLLADSAVQLAIAQVLTVGIGVTRARWRESTAAVDYPAAHGSVRRRDNRLENPSRNGRSR